MIKLKTYVVVRAEENVTEDILSQNATTFASIEEAVEYISKDLNTRSSNLQGESIEYRVKRFANGTTLSYEDTNVYYNIYESSLVIPKQAVQSL